MFKKIILAVLLLSSFSFAMTKNNIKTEMTNKIDKVIMILKDSKLDKKHKGDEIISLMNSVFDYTLMSRLSLGKTWNMLSKDEKIEFTKIFTKKLKNSYVDKLDLYTDQLVTVLGVDEPKKNRIILKTQLIGKDKKYEINYKFYRVKDTNEAWLIYDVDLLGVSIIQTYRKQFSGYLKDKSFQELLAHLKTNNK